MIKPIAPVSAVQPLAVALKTQETSPEKTSFATELKNALNNVNEAQLKADELATKLVLGEVEDLHQVTVAMEQAKLSLQLAVQVRNKIIEAYQEIARMQV